MTKASRKFLPASDKEVMDLKPGEVSEVIDRPNGDHYIYKMVSKETTPLDAVKEDIRKTLSKQRMEDAIKAFQGDVDLNDAYFGPAQTPAVPRLSMGPRPPVQPAPKPNEHQ